VASLGLVSPGAATEGVTPIFLENNDDFLSSTSVFVCHFCIVTPIYILKN